MDSGEGVNVGAQPAGADKTLQEKTTEAKVFDMLENVMSISLQGFFAGSILGLCVENEPRKVANIEHISNASPVQYEEIALSIAKKGAHCAMTLGTIAGTVEALDIMRGKKDPPLHYFAGGVLGGFLAGGSVQLVQNHNPSVPFRFRPGVAVKSSVFFGLAGLGMGLVYNYLEPRFDLSSKTQAKSGSNSVNPGSEKRLDRKIYDALFPSEE